MKRINIILIIALLISLSSCRKMFEMNQPKEVETEYSSIYPLSGEWFVTYQFEHPNGTSGVGDWYGVGYTKLTTFNTSEDDGKKFWITDGGDFWTYKVKSDCNIDAKTFSSTDSLQNELGDDIRININRGKIMLDGGKSLSGVTTDSIYFEIVYGDDAGTTYQVSGIRRTGFLEDELDKY